MMALRRFLLLEDSPHDAEVLQAALVQGGIHYEVLHVVTRDEFIRALETTAFDLILADYALPDFDGIAALEIVHQKYPEIPFIFVSASLGEERAIETLKQGATDYVLKQRLERLVPAVNRALQEAEERRDRKRAEQLLIEQKQLLELIATGHTLDQCLSAVCTAVSRLDPGTRACFLLADADRCSFPRSITPDFAPTFGAGLKDAPINDLCVGTCGEAVYRGQSIMCADIQADTRWSEYWRDLCISHGILACYSTPVFGKDGLPLGSLMLCFAEARQPSTWEYQLASFGTQIASIALERDRETLALHQSENRLRAVAANLPGGAVFIVDHQLRYQLAEGKALASAGITSADLVGKTLWEALEPELADRYEQSYRQALKGEPYQIEHQSHGRYYISHGVPLYSDRGEVEAVLAMSYDITERKRIEQERERFLALGSDLLVIVGNDGYFRWVSPTFERTLGWTLEEMTTRPWVDFLHPDDIDLALAEANSLFAGSQTIAFENRYRHKDGSYRWFLWNAQPYVEEQVIYGAAMDITEAKALEATRKAAKVTLQDSEERLRLALWAAQQGIWDWDLRTQVLTWDERCKQMFGFPPNVPVSYERHLAALHPDDLERVQKASEIALLNQSDFNEEYRTFHPDGTMRWILAQGRGYYDATGKPYRMSGIVMDITDRKQADQEREKLLQREQAAREEAERANRIKDEFLAVLSHELRSPLNPILGWSNLLRNGRLDAEKTDYALATIERNAKLQVQLIEDLLDVSRILRGKLNLAMAPVDLPTTISAAIETVQLAAEAKSIQIQTVFEPGIGKVLGDAARLQQITWNLLTNAVKFTAAGGKVEVRLEQVEGNAIEEITGSLEQESYPYAQMTIKDTGRGIHPDFLPYVFEYFRQADSTTTRKFGGLGLGLAIVRHLVELHGGTVAADSLGEGQGATFTVRIPLQQKGISEAKPDQSDLQFSGASQPQPLSLCHVLLVDDDADTRNLVAFTLEQSGAIVFCAASAIEALQVFSQQRFDVLVSDVGMPDMDGYGLIRQIRARPPEQGGKIPAVVLTAYAGDRDRQQAIDAGFQAHLAKPVEPEKVVKLITNLLQKSNKRCFFNLL